MSSVNVITVVVHDLDRSVRFYAEGLDCRVEHGADGTAVVWLGGPEMPRLELRPWNDLAGTVGSAPDTNGPLRAPCGDTPGTSPIPTATCGRP